MAFLYRKSIDDALAGGKDFTLNATYATTAKAGDVVRLNASGEVILAATTDADVLGVVQGFTFEGVGVTPKIAKVNIDPEAIYEATVAAGTTIDAASIGDAFGINGASAIETDATYPIVKVVEVINGKPQVIITKRQLG